MKKYLKLFLILFIIYFLFIFSSYCFAAWGEPELVSKLNSAFETMQ